MIRARTTTLFVLVALASACGPKPNERPTMLDDGPPFLLPVGTFDGSFMLEQHVTARYGEREDGFDAVLQKRDEALTLVGLGPMGTVAFVVSVTDAGVTLQNDSGHEVPFEPAHIVADVQRVFYPWIEGEITPDGTRTATVHGFVVTERFEGTHLVERRFSRADAPERGEVVISYDGWDIGSTIAPRRVVLANGWYGYALEIETSVAHDSLDDGAATTPAP